MAGTLSTLSIISFVMAGVFLVLSILIWIIFRIPTVIGDLSGRTARKSIAKMRAANEKSGSKGYRESRTNAERGKLTDNMKNSRKLVQEHNMSDERPDTGLLNENRAYGQLSEETGMMESETTGLLVDENTTAPLGVPNTHKAIGRAGGIKLRMLDDIVMIHTDEIIY